MRSVAASSEPTIVRQVFPHWWITIPTSFSETFVADDGYWHAWDVRRSVSLSSIVITDGGGGTLRKAQILAQIPAPRGKPVAMPPGLDGWAVIIRPPKPMRASRAISGMIAVDERLLLATVTADDLAWAAKVWQSVRAGGA
jgi:hypothetical protein